MNRAIILGHLGQTPELKKTKSDMSVCNLSVATSDVRKEEKVTEWHKIVVFGATAENCVKYLTKGRQVLVEGKLSTRKWEKGGQDHYSTEIIADRVEFVGGAKTTENETPTDVKVDF